MPVYRATVDLRFTAGAGRGTNTWSIRTPLDDLDGGSIQNLMALVLAFYAQCESVIPQSSSASWDGTVQELGTPNPEYRNPGTAWTVGGVAPANAYGPAPAMACVTWRTSLAARSGRGRTFLGPLAATAWQGDGSLAPAALTTVRTAAQALVDNSLNDGLDGGIGVWSEVDQVHRDVVSSSVTDQAAILRSRR